MTSCARWLAALALPALLTACAGAPFGVPPVANPAARPAIAAQNVYVAYCTGKFHGTGTIAAYPIANKRVVRKISVGPCRGEYAMAFDASNDLYVTNVVGNSVEVFAPGKTMPKQTITVASPRNLAFDRSGNLYVASGSSRINVYAPGRTTPTRTITDSIGNPSSLAFDSAGNLYVANSYFPTGSDQGSVTVYGAGQTSVLRTIQPINNPRGIAIDGRDDLYVAGSDGVSEYGPGSTKILRSLYQSADGPLLVDGANDVYVIGGQGINEFSPAGTLLRSLSKAGRVTALGLDVTGNLDVAASNHFGGKVSVYAPGATSPFLVIRPESGALRNPVALTFAP